MKKFEAQTWIKLSLIFACLTAGSPLGAFATCEEDCEVPRSCKEYVECRTAHMECLAACKQKEAWDLSAQSSEKLIAATERMTQTLEKTFEISERITRLLDMLITRLAKEIPPQKPTENQEGPAAAAAP